MKSLKKIVIVGITIMILTACSSSKVNNDDDKYKVLYDKLLEEQPPVIENISLEDVSGKVLLEDEAGWIPLSNNSKLTVTVQGNSTEVEVYFVPSGTETYKYQQLIGMSPIKDGKVQFDLNYEDFSDGLGFLWVVVYNDELGRKSEEFKIALVEE